MLERELPPLFNAMQGGCCYAFCGCFSQEAPQIEKDYQAAVAAVLDTAWRQIEDVFVGASQGGYGGVLWTVAEEGVVEVVLSVGLICATPWTFLWRMRLTVLRLKFAYPA